MGPSGGARNLAWTSDNAGAVRLPGRDGGNTSLRDNAFAYHRNGRAGKIEVFRALLKIEQLGRAGCRHGRASRSGMEPHAHEERGP